MCWLLDLINPDFDELRANNGTLITADTGRGKLAVNRDSLPRTLLHLSALGTNGTVGGGPQAPNTRLARQTAAADAVGVVVGGRRKRDFALAERGGATGAASTAGGIIASRRAASFHTSTDQIMYSSTALACDEVLASFMFAGRLGDKLIEGRRPARLTNGVLAGTSLTRAKGPGERSLREASRLGHCRLRAVVPMSEAHLKARDR